MSGANEQEEFAQDWYGILDCDRESSVEQIAKAAREFARKYHPDKNKDPDAPALFLLVQKAKEILLDPMKRGVIDDKLKREADLIAHKQKKDANMDARTKQARNKLEENIKAAAAGAQKRKLSHEEVLHNELRKRTNTINEIHKRNSSIIEESEQYAAQQAYQKAADFDKLRKSQQHSDEIISSCEIKIKWKKSAVSHSDDSLYHIFKRYGTIEQTVIRNGTSGLITYSTESSAKLAVTAYANSEEFR